MTNDKRRRTGFFAAIVADPWRKALAVTLAVLLWFFIDSRINQTVSRTLPLRTVGAQSAGGIAIDQLAIALPLDRVVGVRFRDGEKEIDKVEILLRGPRFRVAAVAKERLDLLVTAFLGLDWEKSSNIVFTAADLRRDQLRLENLEIELVPPRIRLDVERIASQSVPLTLDVIDVVEEQFTNRLRLDTAEFVPKDAVVLGPAIGIDRWNKRPGKRFRAVMQSGNDRQATAQLELIDAEGLRFQTPPLLTMQVVPETTAFDLDLLVLVDDLGLPPEQRGQWTPEQRSRTVRIAVGGNLRTTLVNFRDSGDKTRLQEWAAAHLRLLVHLQKPEPGTALTPEVDRKARLLVVSRLHETVDRNECLLDETVVVKLRRQP